MAFNRCVGVLAQLAPGCTNGLSHVPDACQAAGHMQAMALIANRAADWDLTDFKVLLLQG
jgi:hypothetical protein